MNLEKMKGEKQPCGKELNGFAGVQQQLVMCFVKPFVNVAFAK
jgi:hypothetical protein